MINIEPVLGYIKMLNVEVYVQLLCTYTILRCVHYFVVCVCVLRSVPLCFASVQKGLVPTTWCRAASVQPIPAWIATLAANQKLPAAFAVCPLSIFSNTSLNLPASLGCCIKTHPPPIQHAPKLKVSYVCIKETIQHAFRRMCVETHMNFWQS